MEVSLINLGEYQPEGKSFFGMKRCSHKSAILLKLAYIRKSRSLGANGFSFLFDSEMWEDGRNLSVTISA